MRSYRAQGQRVCRRPRHGLIARSTRACSQHSFSLAGRRSAQPSRHHQGGAFRFDEFFGRALGHRAEFDHVMIESLHRPDVERDSAAEPQVMPGARSAPVLVAFSLPDAGCCVGCTQMVAPCKPDID